MIFGTKKTVEENAIDTGFIQPTSECLDQILTESAQESYQLRAGLYVTDVIMEEKVLFEGASPEVLLEGLGKDLWTKIKNIFSKLKAKVLEWFSKVKRFFSLLFTSGKEFIDKFEDEIRKKVAKGYKYKSYKYTPGKLESLMKEKESNLTSYYNDYAGFDNLETAKNVDSQKERLGNSGSNGASGSASDKKDEILKKLGYDTISEYETALNKAGRNEETAEADFTDFNGNSKDELVRAVSGKDKQLEILADAETKMNKDYSNVIKAIDSASNKFEGEVAGKVSEYVSYSSEILRYILSLKMIGHKVTVEVIKEFAKSSELILKGYLRYKPAKAVTDNFNNPEGSEGTTSILESAMNLL